MAGRGDSIPSSVLGVGTRKALLTVGLAVFLAVAAATLIGRIADWDNVRTRLQEADEGWLAVACGGLLLAYVGYVAGYRQIARAFEGPRLDTSTAARVVVLGLGAGVLGSAPSGLAVDLWALHRAGADLRDAGRRVLALHTLRWALLGTIAAAAGAVVLATGRGVPTGMALGWLVAVPVAAAAAALVATPARAQRLEPPQRAGRGDGGSGGRLARARATARRGASDVLGAVVLVRRIVARPVHHASATAGLPLYWAGDILVLFAALRAFEHGLDVSTVALAFATAHLVTSLPLPAGGSGVVEATLASTLVVVGVPLDAAVLAAFAYRAISFWLPVVVALAALPALRALPGRLDEVEGQA